ncbi:unnamed protein product [Angiostrongylus costaricensis]|uniref:Skp1 domain-containing protein n=1 Tax=Angiostrongylus costaricensis TaxID=334426 RepID=A0A0R3PUK9_ANGCS|nr:unnamed protein product [Angiostrongylus costaricensis]
MRAIRVDNRLAGYRLHRVGIVGSTIFLQDKFTLKRDDIPDDTNEKCSRFPIAVDSDHERYEFSCERRGWAQFSADIDRMFYTIVGETSVIMIGIRAIAIAPLQPPTLVECALMALQDQYCNKDDVGARIGGLSPEDVKKMVGYRGTSLIPT